MIGLPPSPTMPSPLITPPTVSIFMRKLTIFSFGPAFFLCIIHGIIAEVAVPALGLLPQAASALLGAFLLYRDQIAFAGSPVSLTRAHVCASDLGLAAFLLLILILSWADMANRWSRSDIALGAYATVPLMLNCFIHIWFFLSNGVCFLTIHDGCPNCRQSVHAQESAPAMGDIDTSSYRDDVESRSDPFERVP